MAAHWSLTELSVSIHSTRLRTVPHQRMATGAIRQWSQSVNEWVSDSSKNPTKESNIQIPFKTPARNVSLSGWTNWSRGRWSWETRAKDRIVLSMNMARFVQPVLGGCLAPTSWVVVLVHFRMGVCVCVCVSPFCLVPLLSLVWLMVSAPVG